MFAAGLVLFAGASLACGLARSGAMLIAARAVQGAGAAALAPSALAILTATVPSGPARDRAVAVWTAAAAGGGALGWVLGGVLTARARLAFGVPGQRAGRRGGGRARARRAAGEPRSRRAAAPRRPRRADADARPHRARPRADLVPGADALVALALAAVEPDRVRLAGAPRRGPAHPARVAGLRPAAERRRRRRARHRDLHGAAVPVPAVRRRISCTAGRWRPA